MTHLFKRKAGCPWCGYRADAASTLDGEKVKPKPGDFTICLECGEWSVFTGVGARRRRPNDHELYEIAMDQDCRAMRQAWVRAGIKARSDRLRNT